DGEVRLASARGSAQDQRTALADELGTEVAAEQLQAHRGLEGEVEVFDGTQEREASLAHRALDAGLGAMSDFLGDQQREEVTMAQALGFGAGLEFGVESTHGGQMQAAQHAVEIERRHHCTPCGRSSST